MSTTTHSAADAGTHQLGELTVNRMAFGAMRLTGDGIWGPPADRDEALRVLRTAVHELHVNLIDTADAYGPYVSEELIAEALHPYPDDLVIATKGGLERSGPGDWTRNGRPEHLREACEGSLERLRLERIDLYQLHAPDEKVPIEDSIGALVRLQEEGKIRHIGVSNFDVVQLQKAMDVTSVVSVQNRYNVGDRASDPVVDWCQERGIAFLPWQPVAGGHARRALGERADAIGVEASPAQLALAWLLHRAPVVLPIPGTSSVAHLRENVEAAGLKLTEEQAEALSKGD